MDRTIGRMTRIFFIAAGVVAVLGLAAGCGGGAKEAGTVPTGQGTRQQMTSTDQAVATSPSSTTGSTVSLPLCKDRTSTVEVDTQQGAAGTIMTTWRATNTSSSSCRSFGYPGMDFHAANGWLDVQVERGGVDVINQAPAPVVLEPGESLYFVSLWGDVDTQAGPCKQFDRVKVTLPDNFASARLDAKGCVDPELVRVGPVASNPPA
jgi:Domain of unknown function (DUF4232)